MNDMQQRVECLIFELVNEGIICVNTARFILGAIREDTNTRPEIVVNPINTVRDCDD